MGWPDVRSDPGRERAELEAYLGAEFELQRLQRYQETLDREFEGCGDEQAFYRTSRGYLYNLTAFAITGTKLPYLRALTRLVPPGSRVLDYGCGIGSDGLALLEAGYRVEFADFDNPSVEYLSWRLERRGLEAPIHDLDRAVPGDFDAAFAFDVIEHVDDPFDFLGRLESHADRVIVNLLEPAPEESEQALHRSLPITEVLDRAVRTGLLSYGIYHDRSHLVAYGDRVGMPSWRGRLVVQGRAFAGASRGWVTCSRATASGPPAGGVPRW